MASMALVKVGGLWLNKDKQGKNYMSGNMEVSGHKIKVCVFKNTYKKDGENTPDYHINIDPEKSSLPEAGATPESTDDEVPF